MICKWPLVIRLKRSYSESLFRDWENLAVKAAYIVFKTIKRENINGVHGVVMVIYCVV